MKNLTLHPSGFISQREKGAWEHRFELSRSCLNRKMEKLLVFVCGDILLVVARHSLAF